MSLLVSNRINTLTKAIQVIGNLKKETNAIKKIPLINELIEILNQLNQSVKSKTKDPLLEQYKAGAFNNQDADTFRTTIIKVSEAGLSVDDVASGVANWFAYDESRLVA